MVHTEPISRRDHLAQCTQISVAAFVGATYYRFIRPRYIEFPDGAFYHSLQRMRVSAVSPNKVIRVALADDADPWVDVGLHGLEAERTRWIRGELVDGKWQSAELVNGQLQNKVCEGRVLGSAIWERFWPEDPAVAKSVKERCGSGTVWPVDNLYKKAERAIFSLSTAYFKRVCPDPADSEENQNLIMTEGFAVLHAKMKPATDRSKHVGHINLGAIAVDPAFHRCGIGARLMRWGLERAEIEGCPIILIGTVPGQKLYKKLGFEDWGVVSVGELSADSLMIYWPKSFVEGTNAQEEVVQMVESHEVKAAEEAAGGLLAENGSS